MNKSLDGTTAAGRAAFTGALLAVAFLSLLLAPPALAQTRAVWVRPFVSAPTEVRRNPVEARKYVRAELQRMNRAGFDVVFLESFWDGYAIYPSRVVPQRPLSLPSGIAPNDEAGKAETFDALQLYIDEAARFGIKVHAWLHVFHQWNTNLGDVSKSPIFSKHPDWMVRDIRNSPLVVSEAEGANRDIFKVFMSPSNLGVRSLLLSVMRELAADYPALGGVQLDYIRYPLHYPETPFDYSADALERFAKETGLDARSLKTKEEKQRWQDWKTRQVTETVALLSGEVRRRRPKWEISVAVFPDFETTLRTKMQDSRSWAEKGYIDAFYPMCYSPNFETVERWAKEFRAAIKPPTKVLLTLYALHFYRDGKFDGRFPELAGKYKYDGLAIFASQLVSDELADLLGRLK